MKVGLAMDLCEKIMSSATAWNERPWVLCSSQEELDEFVAWVRTCEWNTYTDFARISEGHTSAFTYVEDDYWFTKGVVDKIDNPNFFDGRTYIPFLEWRAAAFLEMDDDQEIDVVDLL